MLADETRLLIKNHIVADYVTQIDQCPTVADMVPPTLTVVKELAKEILKNHHLHLETVDDPQEESKELAPADIAQIAKMLKDAINVKKQKSLEQIAEIEIARKGMLSSLGMMSKTT